MAIRMLPLFGAGLLVCSGTAPAQTFEGHYGASNCRDGGRSVVPVSGGGYISVGQTSCDNCADNNLYVVRSGDDGVVVWSMVYDMGANDIANSVKEVLNDPGGKRGFIITGLTQNVTPGCSTSVDAFLLRLDECGGVSWVRTYGHGWSSEAGHEVLEATTGNTNARPGDFVVAGWTTFNSTAAGGLQRDGYIFRTDANGNLIWDATYELGQDDYFYSLDEAVATATGGQTADIVAAGGTTSQACDGNCDGWIVRVNGNDGKFNALPHNSATFGGSDFEEFKSIRELRTLNPGELVATGTTRSAAASREVYVVQTLANPGVLIADRVFGDQGSYPDEGLAIRETGIGSFNYSAGYIVVTGYMHPAPGTGGFGDEDAFAQVIEPTTLNLIPANPINPFPTTMLYGGDGRDRGLSVESVGTSLPCRTLGYIITGFTQSPSIIGPDPQQLSLIKTNENLGSGCSKDYQIAVQKPHWRPVTQKVEVKTIRVGCTPQIRLQCVTWEKVYCYEALGTDQAACRASVPPPPCPDCKAPDVPDTPLGNKQSNGASGQDASGIVAINGFPNPVKSGSPITLEYRLVKNAPVSITVTDVSGRTIYSGTASAGTASIATKGWTSGSYMVSVSVEGKSTTTRVVVTD